MPDTVKALSGDPAFVTMRVVTIYGTVNFTRDGRPQASNTVSPDGNVTSQVLTNK